MNFSIGDVVSRKSYNNDIKFSIVKLNLNKAYLKGVNVRLYADANIDDLQISDNITENDNNLIEENKREMNLERSKYFYLPGSILHIDGDCEYLDRCMNFYNNMNVKANGICLSEKEIENKVIPLLEDYKPDILVITGHDSISKKNSKEFTNSQNFINAVKKVRRYEKNQDKLLIIAGACQSNYEELIKSGANFASSPKRVNIHALDPAIIAVSLAFSDKNKDIDLINIINKTKYGSDGMGGIITTGTMYKGYPR